MTELKEPRETTVRKLFALSGNRCAFPSCPSPIVDIEHGTILADVCHIRAQNSGGPRPDETQSAEERHGLSNLILLCRNHHKLIDAKENVDKYSAEYLLRLKADHESSAKGTAVPALSSTDIDALLDAVREAVAPTTHMDFRGAYISAGGQGGGLGGGGGGGGVINIFGVTRAGFREPVDLAGKDGRAPGAGGGGGGTVVFSGREVEEIDLEQGLRVTAFLVANAVDVRGLLFVMGGGWEHVDISHVPGEIRLNLALVVDTGNVAPNTLFRFTTEAEAPSGARVPLGHADVTVPEKLRPVVSPSVTIRASFSATELGVWKLRLFSGDIEFSVLRLEVRSN